MIIVGGSPASDREAIGDTRGSSRLTPFSAYEANQSESDFVTGPPSEKIRREASDSASRR